MKLSYYNLHYIFWSALVLFPIITRAGGGTNLAQKLIHVFFFAMFALCFVLLKHRGLDRKIFLSTIIFTLLLITYYIFCTLFFTQNIVVSDFGDLTRPIIYSVYFIVPLLYPLDKQSFEKLFKIIIALCIFQIVFSLSIYIPKLWPLVDLYKGRTSSDVVLMHFYRWSGTFIYPSDFAFYLSFFIYFYFFKWTDAGFLQTKQWLIVLILFSGLLMTFSRGGIFTTIGMLGFSYWFTRAKFNLKINAFLGVVFFAILIVLINGFTVQYDEVDNTKVNIFNVEYLLDSLQSSEDSDASTQHRYNEIDLAVDYSLKVFPFGKGSNGDELKYVIPVIESFYGYHLIKWGWLGLGIYLLSQLSVFIYLRKSIRYISSLTERAFVKSVMVLIVSIPLLFGLSSAISDRFKGLPFYYALLGLAVMICVRYRVSESLVKK